jgi:hypothetical protein
MSRDTTVRIATDYELEGEHSIPDRVMKFVSFPQCQDRLWSPPNLLPNEYHGLFPVGKTARE